MAQGGLQGMLCNKWNKTSDPHSPLQFLSNKQFLKEKTIKYSI